jgi:hypothetical protein
MLRLNSLTLRMKALQLFETSVTIHIRHRVKPLLFSLHKPTDVLSILRKLKTKSPIMVFVSLPRDVRYIFRFSCKHFSSRAFLYVSSDIQKMFHASWRQGQYNVMSEFLQVMESYRVLFDGHTGRAYQEIVYGSGQGKYLTGAGMLYKICCTAL